MTAAVDMLVANGNLITMDDERRILRGSPASAPQRPALE